MRQTFMAGIVVALIAGVATVCVALQPAGGERSEPHYLVTEWPAARASRPYRQFLQEHLNEMAARGWRLDQALISATSARMLVFHRASTP